MKLEKVVSRPRKGLWVFLFVICLVVAGIMATTYNVEIVRSVNFNIETLPWTKIVLGTLGFTGIIGSLILFFARLLREMSISQIQADFLDRISHELRTPISTLKLVADLLKANARDGNRNENIHGENAESKKLWQSHDLELARLQTDVELLLQAARLRETRLQVNFEKLRLSNYLREKVQSFEQLLGPGASFRLILDPTLEEISVDTSLFELILRNLLDNARKFSLIEPKVKLETRFIPAKFFLKSRWQVIVTDQGLGFSPGKGNDLFRRFSRIPFENTELKKNAIPGTGLGLYLSATASKAMGLALSGESLGEGKGARFVIEGILK